MQTPKFKTEIKTVMFGSDMVTVENLTPVLSQKESIQRHREVETILFNVLKKYPTKNHEQNTKQSFAKSSRKCV